MAEFNVAICTDNDAFGDNEMTKAAEVARILHWLASDIAENGLQNIARLRDANGARVGFATDQEVSRILD